MIRNRKNFLRLHAAEMPAAALLAAPRRPAVPKAALSPADAPETPAGALAAFLGAHLATPTALPPLGVWPQGRSPLSDWWDE